jgi:predicted phosphodiesterase
MQLAFDLISDLHIDTWDGEFDWTAQPTSPHCVVIGDVCENRPLLYKTLAHLGKCYQAVFFVDGNDEHANYIDDLGSSYQKMSQQIGQIPNVVYLQDNVVVVNGVAILGTNGWWGFDFDNTIDPEEVRDWWCERYSMTHDHYHAIRRASTTDANYMIASVKRLQTHRDVKKIVMVTHTVPTPELIAHDIDLVNKLKFNVMGNRHMLNALDMDTEHKIDTWCFGHYHGKVDQYRDGVRYVNNCRGRGRTPWSQYVYHPLRVVVDY